MKKCRKFPPPSFRLYAARRSLRPRGTWVRIPWQVDWNFSKWLIQFRPKNHHHLLPRRHEILLAADHEAARAQILASRRSSGDLKPMKYKGWEGYPQISETRYIYIRSKFYPPFKLSNSHFLDFIYPGFRISPLSLTWSCLTHQALATTPASQAFE